MIDFIQIIIFSALSGISVFLFLYALLDIEFRKKTLSSKLLDIKFMFVQEYHDVKKGAKFLQKGRFFVANNTSFLNLDRLKNNLRISGLDKYLSQYDVVFIKIISYSIFLISFFSIMGVENLHDPILYMSENVVFMLFFVLSMFLLYYWDRYLIQIFDSLRTKHYYGQFGQFIIIFSSSINAGDNTFHALKSTIPSLRGNFKNNIRQCVVSYERVGRSEALESLKKNANMEIIDFFVNVINDNDNDSHGLYEYLNKNLSDFIKQLYYIKKNNSEGKKKMLTLATTFGFVSFFLLVSTMILVLNRALQEFI